MKNKLIYLGVLAGGLAACSGSGADVIRLNQVGYYPQQEKVAVANAVGVKDFVVVDAATGEEMLQGSTETTNPNAWTQAVRTTMNFSSLTQPGRYLLLAGGDTAVFEIKDKALAPLADAALKSFYYQRAGMDIEAPYAGQWARPASCPDTEVLVHASAAGPKSKEGSILSAGKGWYEGSDYGKYTVATAYSIGLMHAAYRLFPGYFAGQNVGIPESGNNTPDLLDETCYGLSWLLSMQDPADGGVYHKLTATETGAIDSKPADNPRYVVQKSVTASLDFAAVMAQASTLFKAFSKDYPGFADTALRAAERAYSWAAANPEAFYDQGRMNGEYDPDVDTYEYADTDASDELFWAASELYYATGKRTYRDQAIKVAPRMYSLPSWRSVSTLGTFVWLLPERESKLKDVDAALANSLKSYLLVYAANAVKGADLAAFHAPYGDSENDFFQGCLAEQCANEVFTFAYANCLGEKKYTTNAYRNMDYLLGRNPLGYCFVTGFGAKGPLHPCHNLSAADEVEAPVPGCLVGGPNPVQEDGVTYPSAMPDEAYADVEASKATNRVSIVWNAGLVAAASALDALNRTSGKGTE